MDGEVEISQMRNILLKKQSIHLGVVVIVAAAAVREKQRLIDKLHWYTCWIFRRTLANVEMLMDFAVCAAAAAVVVVVKTATTSDLSSGKNRVWWVSKWRNERKLLDFGFDTSQNCVFLWMPFLFTFFYQHVLNSFRCVTSHYFIRQFFAISQVDFKKEAVVISFLFESNSNCTSSLRCQLGFFCCCCCWA